MVNVHWFESYKQSNEPMGMGPFQSGAPLPSLLPKAWYI